MLSRRELLALVPWAARSAPSDPGSMLWDYFMQQMDELDTRRREALRTADPASVRARVRRTLLEGIGGLPERTPLNPRHAGTLTRSGYAIEKIIFESRPQYYVTANLYRPRSISKPLPGVIQSCGHYAEGKAAADYQRACVGLAQKGFVVLIFDPMGQGERYMYGSRPAQATSEHVRAGKPCLLVGRTLAHFRIWDAMRALDYLETRPEVDKTRLGMFGHSGGGMMTLLTAPLDERLRAVMSCCAVTTFYHKTRALLIADPEQIVPGILARGIDHPELIAAVAPRAFLIGAALKDFVPLEGTRRTYEEVRPIFDKAGIPERFAKVETDDEHKLNQELREACYGWMMKHLAGGAGDAREPAIEVETEAELRCTPTGCVMDLPGARSVFDLNRQYARELRKAPADLASLLALPQRPLPYGRGSESAHALIVLVRAAELASEFKQAGYVTLTVDPRGWGETTPRRKAGFSWDDFFAYRSFEIGRPLLGMRVDDLLTAIEKHPGKIYVVGVGPGGLVALHAAAVSKDIAGVAAIRSLSSYQQIMEHPDYTEPVASFVPGALLHYDLPQLAERIRPRPCLITADRDVRPILKGLGLA